MPISHRRMRILTHLVIHFLSRLLVVVQRNLLDFEYGCYLSRISQTEGFANFENLDGGLVSFDNGHKCQIEGICIVRIKLFDRMVRELKNMRYVP